MTRLTGRLAAKLKVDPEMVSAVMREFGRLGGLTKSPARAKASRENGKLGGRPPKNGKKKPKGIRAGQRTRADED
jgi:hypothetical protein